jgi:hypothetical protein
MHAANATECHAPSATIVAVPVIVQLLGAFPDCFLYVTFSVKESAPCAQQLPRSHPQHPPPFVHPGHPHPKIEHEPVSTSTVIPM